MALISYPPYLTSESLPLRQPVIAKCVNETFHNEKISTLISEYACPSNEVETQGMIDFFLQRIPTTRIEMMKKALPEVSLCLEGTTPTKEVKIFMGSYPLKNSAERRLVALACVFLDIETDSL